jgi:hypothetical protein
MKAETAIAHFVPPDLVKHSPGVAKGWVSFTGATPATNASYNVASVTDSGTGAFTVNWATDFSGIHYSITFGHRAAAAANEGINVNAAPVAASCDVNTYSASGSLLDFPLAFVTAHGDQ